MPKLTITPEDMLRSKLLNPGWYRLKITKVVEELSQKGDANNEVVDFKVVHGPPQKDGIDAAGTPVRVYFSEKWTARALPLFKALGGTWDGKKAITVDFDVIVGKEVEGYIVNQLDKQNVMRNQVEDYRPAHQQAAGASEKV